MAWSSRNPDGSPNFRTLDDRPAAPPLAGAITADKITEGSITIHPPAGWAPQYVWYLRIAPERPNAWRRFWAWFLLGATWEKG